MFGARWERAEGTGGRSMKAAGGASVAAVLPPAALAAVESLSFF